MVACGIRIAVNGSETDTDVEADSASWKSKIGNVKISGGGGSWWKTGSPFVCTFDADVPEKLAAKIRTVTIAVTADVNPSPLPATLIAGSPPYRIVFNGDVVAARVRPGQPIEFDAASDMSALMNRRASVAADSTVLHAIRTMLNDIETAHGLTMSGQASFPAEDGTFFDLARPKQGKRSNGELIRSALSGIGINMTEEWDGTITAPTLRWRADYQEPSAWTVSTTRHLTTEIGYPWAFTYDAVGFSWQDFTAKIILTGEGWDGAVNEWAWCRLTGAAQRAKCGEREVRIATWIRTQTQLKEAAQRLLGHQGRPDWLRMQTVSVNLEHYARTAQAGGAVDYDVEVAQLGTAMIGDTLDARNPFDNSHASYADWPSGNVGDPLYDRLLAYWKPVLTNDTSTATVTRWVIRSLERRWDPNDGWTLEFGLDPYNRLGPTAFPAGDVSSGSGDF